MNKAVKKYVSKRCPKCQRVFLLGFNGAEHNGVDMCDKCAGIVRDSRGYIKRERSK